VLAQEVGTIMRAADIRERMLNQGFEPAGSTPPQFSHFIREEISRWERVVKTAGIKPQ
jgi:tripartite-type tricarboxylate transporter receptor subunit TctC